MKKFIKKVFSIFFILIAVFALFFYFGVFTKQIEKAKGYYYVYLGDKAYKKKDLVNAINFYKLGLEKYPAHYLAANNLGNIYVAYEDYFSASDAYLLALKYKPEFLLCRINYALILANQMKNYEEAINQYKKATDAKVTNINIPFIYNNKESTIKNKGLAFYNMGLSYRALSLLSDDNYVRNENLMKSKEMYENALKFLESDYNTFFNLAIANHLLGNYKDAGQNYCKAIELRPLDYEAHYNLAIMLKKMKRFKESYNELEKAVLIMDVNGDAKTSRYIFDILNEVSQRLAVSGDYNYLVEHLSDESKDGNLTYIDGKVVVSDEFDEAMNNNMEVCEGKNLFF